MKKIHLIYAACLLVGMGACAASVQKQVKDNFDVWKEYNIETLSRWYDVRFETDGQPDRPISYTFATDNTLLDNVLREMELISPVRFERTKTEIKVSFR